MQKLNIEEFDSERSSQLSEHRDQILFLLNQVNVELMLMSANDTTLTKAQFRVVTGLCLNAIQSGMNISRLVHPLTICCKDALAIARTYFETCLNICWHLADEGERAERSQLYTIYKLFKTQKVHYKLGKTNGLIEHSVQFDRNSPQVKKAIALFEPSGSKAKPKKCFDVGRERMIQDISISSPFSSIAFEGVEQMNWEHASEIAHGSFFSFELAGGNYRNVTDRTVQLENTFVSPSTYAVVLCSDAVARMLLTKFPKFGKAIELANRAELFYRSEVPEMAEMIRALEIKND